MFVSGWEESDDQGISGSNAAQKDPRSRILWAAEHGRLDLAKELIETDPELVNSVDEDNYTPLHRAAYNNHVDIIKYLLEHGANAHAWTSEGWEPLHSACKWGNVEAAYALLNGADIDVNCRTNGNLTPLHLAASCNDEPGSLYTAQMLLQHPKINLCVKSNGGETPWDVAKATSMNMMKLFEDKKPPASLEMEVDDDISGTKST